MNYSDLVDDIVTGEFSAKELARKYSGVFSYDKVVQTCHQKGLVEYQRIRRAKYLDSIRGRVVELLKQGLSNYAVAKNADVTRYDVITIRQQENIDPLDNSVSPERVEAIRAMFEAGKSDEEIGKVFGKTEVAIRSFRHRNSIFHDEYNSVTMTALKPLFEDPNYYTFKVSDAAKASGINRATVAKYLAIYNKEKAAK